MQEPVLRTAPAKWEITVVFQNFLITTEESRLMEGRPKRRKQSQEVVRPTRSVPRPQEWPTDFPTRNLSFLLDLAHCRALLKTPLDRYHSKASNFALAWYGEVQTQVMEKNNHVPPALALRQHRPELDLTQRADARKLVSLLGLKDVIGSVTVGFIAEHTEAQERRSSTLACMWRVFKSNGVPLDVRKLIFERMRPFVYPQTPLPYIQFLLQGGDYNGGSYDFKLSPKHWIIRK
jgi:hypothetical protein